MSILINQSKSSSVASTPTSDGVSPTPDKMGIVLQGYLKKLKTMKKKYFVLHSDGADKSARLEYYDSEKKFRSRNGHPKRCIVLKSCFHISRRIDTKQKFVIALYTKDDSFCIVMENEVELNRWLKVLQTLHRIEEEFDLPRTNFEHVWEVQMHRRGLAVDKNIVGSYHLCLTDKALRLARTGSKTTLTGEPRMPFVEFLLTTIRRSGNIHRFFYMEVGRHSAIGAGELYMETDDTLIAQNMHTIIMNAMSTSKHRDDLGPVTRNRSSSANEASKPVSMLQRRQTHVGAKPLNFSPSNETEAMDGATAFEESTGSSVVTVVNIDCESKTNYDDQISQRVIEPDGVGLIKDIDHGHDQRAPSLNSFPPYHICTQNFEAQSDYSVDAESVSSNCLAAIAVSTQSIINNIQNTVTNTSPSIKTLLLITSSATLTTTTTTNLSSSSCNPQYLRLMQNSSYHRRHSVSVAANSAITPVSHQRALSLPITTQPNVFILNSVAITVTSATSSSSSPSNNNIYNSSMVSEPMVLNCCHQRTRSLPLTEETAVQPSSFVSANLPTNSLYKNILLHSNSTVSGLSSSNSSIAAQSGKSICQCTCDHRTSDLISTVTTTNHFTDNHHINCHFHQQSKYHQCINNRINNNNIHLANSQRFSQCSHGNLPLISHKNDQMIANESMLRMLIGNKTMTNSMDSIAEDQILSTPLSQLDDANVHPPNNTVSPAIHIDSYIDTITNCSMSPQTVSNAPTPSSLSVSSTIYGGSMHSLTMTSSNAANTNRTRNNINTTRSSNLVRDRCDSLPSRNRTTSDCSSQSHVQDQSMPPPRALPLSTNRPHSMYTTQNNSYRHSNSPPYISNNVNANHGPLSPSAGCSESDGSTHSVDEADGCYSHTLTPDDIATYGLKYFSARTSGSVIPEENMDEFWTSPDGSNSKDTASYINTATPKTLGQNTGCMGSSGSLILPIQPNQSATVNSNNAIQNVRRSSPGPIYSPCRNSPSGEPASSYSGYMLMSPAIDFSRNVYTGSGSGPQSQASSLAEEHTDAYVPVKGMQHPSEEYIDMDQNSSRQHNHNTTTSSMSSAASSCSITSGTPSTDMRFAEYHMDKVVSHITPDDEDTSLMNERPIRAYSVGSRLEHNKRKLRVDMLTAEHNQNQNSRVRAFSVGSRAKIGRSEIYHGHSNPSYLKKTSSQEVGDIMSTLNNNITGSTVTTTIPKGNSKKSSSTPLLVSLTGSKHTGSVDPMDDLMEIDFTKKDDDSLSTDSNYEHKHISCDDLMEIDYPQYQQHRTTRKLSITNPQSACTPLRSSQPVPITANRERSIDIGPNRLQSAQKVAEQKDQNGYINMKPIGSVESTHNTLSFNGLIQQELNRSSSLSSSPVRSAATASTSSIQNQKKAYVDMRAKVNATQSYTTTPSLQASSSMDDYLNMSPVSVRNLNTSSQQRQSSHDGYMHMSWGNKLSPSITNRNNNNNAINNNISTNLLTVGGGDTNLQSSSSSTSSNEYINMSFNNCDDKNTANTSSGCRSSNSSACSNSSGTSEANARLQSLPIAIKTNKQQDTMANQPPQSCFTDKIYPPTHLSLNMDTTNPTADSFASARCDSKDSGIATPTGQPSSIFPFSPNSPNGGTSKQINSSQCHQPQLPNDDDNNLPRKCLVDGTTGTLCISDVDQSTSVQHGSLKSKAAPHVDVLSNNYAEMNLGSCVRSSGPTLSPKENIKKLRSSFFGFSSGDPVESDYVNCSATEPTLPRTPRKKTDTDDMAGEYALMDPTAKCTPRSTNASPIVLTSKKSILFTSNNNPDKVLANTQSKTNTDGFRPISSNFDQDMRNIKNQSPKSMSSVQSNSFNRQHSAPTQRHQSIGGIDTGGYELLELRGSSTEPIITHGRLTRPNSVNSEKSSKISLGACGPLPFTSSTRPNSANSDRLQSISTSSSNEGDSSSTISTSSSASTILRPQSSSFLSSGSEYSASSRPSSVVSVIDPSQCNSTTNVTSRPPSVSSERELHYSILDLPPCSSSTSINIISSNNSNAAAAATQVPEQSTFTYAQIDFVKSDANAAHNTKP